jgi:hypothetical protein
MTPASALRAARDLVSDHTRWARFVSARDAEGVEVEPIHPEACRWCAHGALRYVTADHFDVQTEAFTLLQNASNEVHGGKWNEAGLTISVTDVNDTLGHDAVMEVFARAIDQAETNEWAATAPPVARLTANKGR